MNKIENKEVVNKAKQILSLVEQNHLRNTQKIKVRCKETLTDLVFTSIPVFNNISATSFRPFFAAQCNAVCRVYIEEMQNRMGYF